MDRSLSLEFLRGTGTPGSGHERRNAGSAYFAGTLRVDNRLTKMAGAACGGNAPGRKIRTQEQECARGTEQHSSRSDSGSRREREVRQNKPFCRSASDKDSATDGRKVARALAGRRKNAWRCRKRGIIQGNGKAFWQGQGAMGRLDQQTIGAVKTNPLKRTVSSEDHKFV